MSAHQDKSRRANEVRAARIGEIGIELMGRFNHGLSDPSQMAVNGHDTVTGYEFFIERDGRTFKVTVELEE